MIKRHFPNIPATQMSAEKAVMLSRGLEAAFDPLEVMQTFRDIIPSLTTKLKATLQSISGLVEDKEPVDGFSATAKRYEKDVKAKLATHRFIDFQKTLTSTPEGFSGNLIEYGFFLLEISVPLFKEANSLLGEYCAILAVFLTNKEDRRSLQDHTSFYSDLQKKRERIIERMEKFYKKESNVQKAHIGDLITRFSDLDEVANVTKDLSKARKKAQLEDVNNRVRQACDMLERVVAMTQRDSTQTISPEAARNVAEGAYEVGKYVELISIYAFRVEQYTAVVKNMFDTVDRCVS